MPSLNIGLLPEVQGGDEESRNPRVVLASSVEERDGTIDINFQNHGDDHRAAAASLLLIAPRQPDLPITANESSEVNQDQDIPAVFSPP